MSIYACSELKNKIEWVRRCTNWLTCRFCESLRFFQNYFGYALDNNIKQAQIFDTYTCICTYIISCVYANS